ncbi:hypothetical protein ABPG72_014952 [Tetrahymena utriculariae]
MMLLSASKNNSQKIVRTIKNQLNVLQIQPSQSLKYNFCSKNNQNAADKQTIQMKMQEVQKIDQQMQQKLIELEKKIIANQFDEKKFVIQFQSLFNNYNLNKEEQVTKLINQLKMSIDLVQKLQTIVGVIDKAVKYNIFLSKDFEIKLLNHGLNLINNQKYYSIKSDEGDLIRALTLVAGLKKIKHLSFYESIIEIIKKEDISKKNLLTIIETLTYNKLLPQLKNGSDITECLAKLAQLTPNDLEIFSPISNLICYYLKNKQTIALYDQNAKFSTVSEQIFKSVHNCLYTLISQQTPDKLDVFLIAEIQNHLEMFAKLSQKEEALFIQKKFNNLFYQYMTRNFAQKQYYDYEKVLRYVKKFIAAPPIVLNPIIVKLIGSTYQTVNPNNISEIVPFLYFLSKTVQNFKVPYECQQVIEKNLQHEKNIIMLSKLMEIYATTHYSNDQPIQDLEQRIIQLSSYSANPTSPLLILFQSLANMHRGQTQSLRYIIDYFKYPGVLDKIEFFDLIVKFIPSLAIKTKELYKFATNMGFQSQTNLIDETNRIDLDFQNSLEQLWDKVESLVISRIDDIYYDKYPTLLLHFMYANLMKNKYKRIFFILQQRVTQYLDKYTPKQVSEIIYSYARMHEKNNELFFKSIPTILKNIHQFNTIELINIYWGYANVRIYDDQLCTALEESIIKEQTKVNPEGYIQFFHAIGIFSRQINTGSKLDEFIRSKIYNLEQMKINIQQQFALGYAVLLFNNRSQYSLFWENIINLILQNQTNFISSPIYMNYLYQIYIHLRYSESIFLPCMQLLLQVLIKNRDTLIRFYKVNKRYTSSDLEKKITSVIDEKIAAPQNDQKVFVVQIKNDVPLIFYDDLRELEQNPKFPEHELIIPYTLDCRKGALCFEVNGPQHYLTDNRNQSSLDGVTLLKKNFLEKLGFKYIEIKYTEFVPGIVKEDSLLTQKVMDIIKEQMKDINAKKESQ